VDEALDAADELSLLSALQLACLALRGLRTDNGPWYLDQLLVDRQQKALVRKCTQHLPERHVTNRHGAVSVWEIHIFTT